jgi:hypothetical protein
MLHWNSLDPGAREMLGKLIEGRLDEPTGENLAALIHRGLIERAADGWQVTPAGRSAYVVRDRRKRAGLGWISNAISNRRPRSYWLPDPGNQGSGLSNRRH